MEGVETEDLQTSTRYVRIIAQASISRLEHLVIEQVTNSVDAGSRGSASHIIVDIIAESDRVLTVRDKFGGMSADDMLRKIRVIGSHTSGESTRGLIGRGLRDCITICNMITITSVKDNKLSQCCLLKGSKFAMIKSDVDVTQEDRSKYGIPANGTHVRNELLEPIGSLSKLYTLISNQVQLRNIIRSDHITVVLSGIQNGREYRRKLVYEVPRGKQVVKYEYRVEGYDTTATLVINVADKELPFAHKDASKYGIVVQSFTSVYESSSLYYVDRHSGKGTTDYMWNKWFKHIFGTLTCDKIDTLARKAADGDLSPSNPRILFDPSRRTGLDNTHPFIIALFSPAYKFLEIALGKMQEISDSNTITSSDVKGVMDNFANYVSERISQRASFYTWGTKEDTQNLLDVMSVSENVEIDPDFMGIDEQQMKDIKEKGKMKVKSEQTSSSHVEFLFTDDPNLTDPYEILYYPGSLKIKFNVNDESMSKWMHVETSDDGSKSVKFDAIGKGLTAIGGHISTGLSRLMTREQIMDGKFAGIDTDAFNSILRSELDSRHAIAKDIYLGINTSIDAIKSARNST